MYEFGPFFSPLLCLGGRTACTMRWAIAASWWCRQPWLLSKETSRRPWQRSRRRCTHVRGEMPQINTLSKCVCARQSQGLKTLCRFRKRNWVVGSLSSLISKQSNLQEGRRSPVLPAPFNWQLSWMFVLEWRGPCVALVCLQRRCTQRSAMPSVCCRRPLWRSCRSLLLPYRISFMFKKKKGIFSNRPSVCFSIRTKTWSVLSKEASRFEQAIRFISEWLMSALLTRKCQLQFSRLHIQEQANTLLRITKPVSVCLCVLQ